MAELWPQKIKTASAKGKKRYENKRRQRLWRCPSSTKRNWWSPLRRGVPNWTAVSAMRWQHLPLTEHKPKNERSHAHKGQQLCVCVCGLLGVVWTNIAGRRRRWWRPDMTKWKCVARPQAPRRCWRRLRPGTGSAFAFTKLGLHNYYLKFSFAFVAAMSGGAPRISGSRRCWRGVCNFASCVSFFIFGALWVPFGNGNCNANQPKPNKVNRQFLKRLMLWVIVQAQRRETHREVETERERERGSWVAIGSGLSALLETLSHALSKLWATFPRTTYMIYDSSLDFKAEKLKSKE